MAKGEGMSNNTSKDDLDQLDKPDQRLIELYQLGQYKQALSYILQALELQRQTHNLFELARSLHNIGAIYQRVGELEKAQEFYIEAVVIRHQLVDFAGIAISLSSIGSIYEAQSKSEKALHLYKQAMYFFRQASNLVETAQREEERPVETDLIGKNTSLKGATMSRNRLALFIGRSLIYLVLALPVIWLFAGIVLFLLGHLNAANWQNMFMLRDNLLVSLVLLLIVVIIYWMSMRRHWKQFFNWLDDLDPLKHPVQAAILLSVIFFATLLIMPLIFTNMTGYSFKSDWTVLLVATIPVLALIALILIRKYSSLSGEFAGFKIALSESTITPETEKQTIKLDLTLAAERINFEINNMIQTGEMSAEVRILVVRIDDNRRLAFSELYKHVNDMSTMSSLQYIIFTKKVNHHYLGFITVEKFKANYHLLQKKNNQDDEITEENLQKLCVYELNLKASTEMPAILDAYCQMLKYNLPGIPVLDEGLKFMGMMERSNIEQQVIVQLLKRSVS